MTNRLTMILALAATALFAVSALAQDSQPTLQGAEAEAERTVEDGSGEGEEVEGRAVGPIGGPSAVGVEQRQEGPRSVGSGSEGGDEDGTVYNGSGGN